MTVPNVLRRFLAMTARVPIIHVADTAFTIGQDAREGQPRHDQRWSRWHRAWPGQRQDNGRYVRLGALLIGPGGHWRPECSVPGRRAEGEAADGNDGERGWSWRRAAGGDAVARPAHARAGRRLTAPRRGA
jgi:hypothetical protein